MTQGWDNDAIWEEWWRARAMWVDVERRRRRKIIEFHAHCSPLCNQEYILMMWDLMRSALEYDFSPIITLSLQFSPFTGVWFRVPLFGFANRTSDAISVELTIKCSLVTFICCIVLDRIPIHWWHTAKTNLAYFTLLTFC